ncbi:MAG TPA: penicillin acylase family protein [Bacteroidota bacterium]|nr:penicillin acylase family protein [Bacteroidota bacterium]
MHPRVRILIGVGLTIVVVCTALLAIAYFLATKSFPQTTGSIVLDGIREPVEIHRDTFGMPHVFASNDHDAYVAAGFLHAQDRLWQMELIRRAGEGRLAEILGEKALRVDRLFRTLGLLSVSRQIALGLEPESRTALESYAAGVNAYIAGHRSSLPVEFDMLGIEPDPWLPEHSILLSKLMAWELNYSRWVDITYGYVVERVGESRARELYPDWPLNAPVIVPKELQGGGIASLGADLLSADRAFQEITGLGGFGSGSNSWVVSGAKTVTGKPMLANDPHLILTTPARWYEMHLSTPTLDVSGASLPGIPFIVIGRNRSIAWGVTNAMLDDEDFYVEEVDSVEHPTRYRTNGSWRPIDSRVDTILVKDQVPVVLTSYRTHRGPIVNRIEPAAALSPRLLSMRWTGMEVSSETQAFYKINRATNWKQFREGLRFFFAPAQNFVYADTAGNIGYYTGGRIPLRKVQKLASPFPGWTDEYDWKGYVPFGENPHSFNPAAGFLATANNRIVDASYPYYLSNQWEPSWRIQRIEEVLKLPGKLTLEDLQRLQLDVVSPQARIVVPHILRSCPDTVVTDGDVRTALTYFRNWNFAMRQEDVATSLFQSFLMRAIHNTFDDELGDAVAQLYDTLAARPLIAITELLQKDSSAWFDDVRTDHIETKNEIIRKSLEEGVRELREQFGGELKEWNWGTVHQVEFSHIFGENTLLRALFNVGPFPVGGSHSTVWKGDFRIRTPFRNFVGPSTRQIFDLADPNNTRAVTPPGQSGQLYHKNYSDQTPLWLAGAYRMVPMDRVRIERASYDILRLLPLE